MTIPDQSQGLTQEGIEELVNKINDFIEAARAMGLPVTTQTSEDQQHSTTQEGNNTA